MYTHIKSVLLNNSKKFYQTSISTRESYPSRLVHVERLSLPKYLCYISQSPNNSIVYSNVPPKGCRNWIGSGKQHSRVRNHMFNHNRSFHLTPRNNEKKLRPIPKLLYMQNPLTWLTNKLDFGMLRRAWDPQFDESEFKRGTKQAVSTITKFVSQNMFSSLKGLLTKPSLASLQHDVETKWSDEQRRLIELEPEDIQLAVTRKVHFRRIFAQKFCDVDMIFIGMKWIDHGGSSALIFVEIISRFHREYTEGHFPDWTVSLFTVTRFNILPR